MKLTQEQKVKHIQMQGLIFFFLFLCLLFRLIQNFLEKRPQYYSRGYRGEKTPNIGQKLPTQ